MSAKIQVRRDTAAAWSSANPVLLRGEIGFEYDTVKVKIGNGTSAWNSLSYAIVSQTMVESLIADHEAALNPHPQYETSAEAQAKVDAHANLTNNPHSVTKAQVGLGNVDNTSDANKPVSTATQAALDLKANSSDVYTKTESDSNFEPKNSNIQSHISNTSNPHSTTKVQVGLSNVDNTSDANKPISIATQSALDLKYDASNPSGYVDASGAASAAPVQSVAGKTGAVTLTKSDVGLSSVPNVDATSRANHTGTQLASTISDFSSATDARVELQKGSALGIATLDSGGKVPSSQLPSTIMEFKGTWNASTNTPTLANGSGSNLLEDAGHVYVCSVAGTVNFGAGNISFAAGDWVILSASLVWEKSVNSNAVVSVNGYQGIVVLDKTDIGLSNVSNLAPSDLPISTATQSALNLKANSSDVYTKTESDSNFEPKNANIQSHISSTSNPHSVTKSQVGLGNVDNTSDINKPVSTATQTALDLKYDASNPSSYVNASGAAAAAPVQSVAGKIGTVTLTKSDVGLSNVPNTDATLRANHTGTQLASTISDFAEAAQDAVGGALADSSSIDFNYNDATDSITAVVLPAGVDHNSLQNYVANNHVDHSSVSISAGTGLSGGGDITASRTLSLANTAVSSGSYGSAGSVGTFTVDQQGRLTAASNTSISITASQVSDFTSAVQGVTIDAAKIDGGVVSNAEFATLDGITTGVSIQSQINGKQATITGAATTITSSDLTISRALASDASGKVTVSATTASELGFVSGVTSSIQSQLNSKLTLLTKRIITSGTTYTPTAGVTLIEAVLIGAGGGGGGVTGANNNIGAAGAGGAGAMCMIVAAVSSATTYTVAIGTAGSGGTAGNNNGTSGTATTLTIGATTYSAGGGVGGTGQTAGTTVATNTGGAGGTATNGQINLSGETGPSSLRLSGTVGTPAAGANSPYGSAGTVAVNATPGAAAGYGAGGAGAFSSAAGNRAGGNGAPGVIIITEYA